MNRLESLPAAAFGLALLGAFYIGCMQDFSVFDPVDTTSAGSTGEAATSSGPGGTGGDISVSSSDASTGSNVGGAGGSTPAGTGGAGGAGGSGPLENCLNGADDDGDGETDCSDPDCTATGFTCVDDPPGWDGPVVLFSGAMAAKPECPAAFPDKVYEGYGDPSGDPATCSACSCDTTNVDVDCNTKNLLAYTQAGCMGQPFMVDLTPGDCFSPGPNMLNIQSHKQNPPDVSTQGSCTPSKVQATVPPSMWGATALVCAGSSFGKGCGGGGDVCAPKGQAPFEGSICIWRDGDHGCPQAYPDRHVYNNDPTDIDDTRDCTDCTCGDASGTCTATTELYSDDKCTMKHNDVPNDGVCKDTMKGVSVKLITTTTASCPAQGGMPTGDVAALPFDVTTVCCAQ